MNEFDEDKWTREQRTLDARIAADMEGLGGSRYTHELAGGALGAWTAGAQDTAKAIRAQVARLTHAKRRAHWEAELTALGLPRPPEPPSATASLTGAVDPKATLMNADKPKGGKAKDG